MSRLTILLTLFSLLSSGLSKELVADDSRILINMQRWQSLAIAAGENRLPLMERTFLQLAFVHHPYFGDLKSAVQQVGMPLSRTDVSFSFVSYHLAWNMILNPITDDDYDTAKSFLIVGAKAGGITWYTADAIARASVLTRDFEEASEWASIAPELFKTENFKSEIVLGSLKKRLSEINEIRSMTPWNEAAAREKLGFPALSNNRVAPLVHQKGNNDTPYFLIFASPRRETATLMAGNGEITTVVREVLDTQGKSEFDECEKAVNNWKRIQDYQEGQLRDEQKKFKAGIAAMDAIVSRTYTSTLEKRPRIIQISTISDENSPTWSIDGMVAMDAAKTLDARTKSWPGTLAQAEELAMREMVEITREVIRAAAKAVQQ